MNLRAKYLSPHNNEWSSNRMYDRAYGVQENGDTYTVHLHGEPVGTIRKGVPYFPEFTERWPYQDGHLLTRLTVDEEE